ncbi:MAG: hypothetical protein WC238_06005 [Parcubacteria group bacterium]|jgi:hypothetical protein
MAEDKKAEGKYEGASLNNLLIYTFRTNPLIERVRVVYPELFIFGKLKADLVVFKNKLIKEKPKLILGFAIGKTSQFEKIAVNRFNEKKIVRDGAESFELFIPDNAFKSSIKPTGSFCNWTIYQLANFIAENKLDCKLIFVHVEEKDYLNLLELIKKF